MNEDPVPSKPRVIPPPDLPQPQVIPPPDLPRPQVMPAPDLSQPQPAPAPDSARPVPPPTQQSPVPVPPVVKIRIRDAAASEPQAGDLASFNTRVIAAVIDLLVMLGLQIPVAMILPFLATPASFLLGIAYLVARDSLPFMGGQSVGKKAMKIKVVTMDGNSLVGNWEAALIRNGPLAIPPMALIELVILLTREDKPDHGIRFGDEWAKTKVILAPNPPAAAE